MTLDTILRRIRPIDEQSAQEANARHACLTKPPGSLGELEALGTRLAAIYGTARPRVTGRGVAVFAGDHGITDEGVSAYPKAVTEQMVHNFLRGGAAINALSRVAVTDLLIVDVGVDGELPEHPRLLHRKVARGTRNMLEAPAMTRDEMNAALLVGAEVAHSFASSGINLVVGGEIGIGNSTSAAAITATFTQREVREVTGPGTGLGDDGLERKRRIIEEVLRRHQPQPSHPLEALRKIGGLEIAALTGFYIGAAAERLAIVLDGFISTSAALVATALEPQITDYLFASHCSTEPGHAIQLQHLGLSPLFNLRLRLGEGTGGVLALPLLESAAATLSEMATFEEANVATARLT